MYYFVTGGSRGIGAGIVEYAARRGHHVAFTYVGNREAAERSKQAAEAAGKAGGHDVQIRHYQLDVKDPVAVEAVADKVLDEFETMEVIVNCAGVNRDNLVVSMADEEWREVLATNLDGPFYVCRQFLQTLIANRFGRIINISSIQHEGGTGQSNYAAAKAGLHGLTKTLAKEYGRRGRNGRSLRRVDQSVVGKYHGTRSSEIGLGAVIRIRSNLPAPFQGGD
jgi:NAD(P)-dependent dehydrogenase (short-subunit alcohol dehydrogenase family)